MAKSKSLVSVSKFEKDGKVFPTIMLKQDADAKFGFTFGYIKAKLIVDNYDAIVKFIADNKATQEGQKAERHPNDGKKAPAKKKAA